MSIMARLPLRIPPPPKLSRDFREAEAQLAKPGHFAHNALRTPDLLPAFSRRTLHVRKPLVEPRPEIDAELHVRLHAR
jgi:hypothetical protein